MNPTHLPPGVQYRHVQVGWPVILGVAGSFALFLGIVVGVSGRDPAVLLHPIVAVPLVFLALITAVFGVLRTEIRDDAFLVAFGPGRPRRVTPLERIRSVRVVRNHWLYGWGIRITPHGWLWNASGLDAVEIELEGGKRFRVGTDDPRGLAEALAWAAGLDG
jgi:hypothetical protein